MKMTVFMIGMILSAIGMMLIRFKTERIPKQIWRDFIKILCGATLMGCLVPLVQGPIAAIDILLCGTLGMLSAELLFLLYLTLRGNWQSVRETAYCDDGIPPKFYITGDKHRDFDSVKEFCHVMNTRRKDVLIILGDAGFNYYEDVRDDKLKREISKLNITLFCLHGNKEKRPQNISTYGIRSFCGGKVYYEPKYPNIFFAIDGEIYNFEGKKYMVVGGAHSVDKSRRLAEHQPFWYDEMPDESTKAKVEWALFESKNRIFGMMTHTCPIDYLPREMFLSTRQNVALKCKTGKTKSQKSFLPDIDRSTEEWLGKLEKKLHYTIWFCGHYHIDKQLDKVCMMHHEIRPLHRSWS